MPELAWAAPGANDVGCLSGESSSLRKRRVGETDTSSSRHGTRWGVGFPSAWEGTGWGAPGWAGVQQGLCMGPQGPFCCPQQENMAGAEPGVRRARQLGSGRARHHRCHRGPQPGPPSVQRESAVPGDASAPTVLAGVFSASGREAPAVYPQAPVQAHRAFPGMGHSKVPATEPCWRCPASASCPPCARVLCPEGEGQSLLPAGCGEGPCPSSGPDLALLLRPALACHILPRAPPWTGLGSTSVSICCLGPPDLLLLSSCQAS